MIVIGGSASTDLAGKVAKQLGQEPGRIEIKRFPDGEKYIRIHEDVKGQDVALIQSLYRTPDEYVFEYLLIADTLRDMGAASITGVTPYLAYARQDSRFYPGEALSSASLAKCFEAAGTTSIITLDCHLHRRGDVSKVFKIPAHTLPAMTLAEAATACRKKGARRIFVLCTHPVLADGALKRIRAAGASRIVGTDTIPSPISTVSVAPVIAAALRTRP